MLVREMVRVARGINSCRTDCPKKRNGLGPDVGVVVSEFYCLWLVGIPHSLMFDIQNPNVSVTFATFDLDFDTVSTAFASRMMRKTPMVNTIFGWKLKIGNHNILE
jgi:hypothetical protein